MVTAEQIRAAAPFTGTLGITFEALSADEVRATLPFDETLSTIGGGLHGGATMSLADISATVCAVLNAAEGAVAPTSESTTHFLRPVAGSAFATARPLRAGRTTVVVEVDVHDESGALCARTTQMHAVSHPRS